VVASKIMVHSKPFLALFDSGTSHCFISDSFTALHSIPLNGVVISNRIYTDCTVELCNRKPVVDMLVLDTRGYDVILGMTWLSRYHAVINCRNKSVIFKNPAST